MNSIINEADIFVLIVFAICIYSSYKAGLIKAVFNLFSIIIAIIATKIFIPYMAEFIKNSSLFSKIQESVIKSINLNETASNLTLEAQANLIDSLNIPEFFKSSLLENNNSEIYKILNVDSITDYIIDFISGVLVNIISAVTLFLFFLIALKILSVLLGFAAKLPVISVADKIGGIVFGAVKATILIWIVFFILTLFFAKDKSQYIFELIDNSNIAIKLYDNNILLKSVLRIFV